MFFAGTGGFDKILFVAYPSVYDIGTGRFDKILFVAYPSVSDITVYEEVFVYLEDFLGSKTA